MLRCEPQTDLVREQRAYLCGNRAAELGRGLGRRAQRAIEFRRVRGVTRARPPQPLRDLLEVLLGAVPELDLELGVEALGLAADKNLDLVDRNLGQLGAVRRDR